jgi:hypothetical protein
MSHRKYVKEYLSLESVSLYTEDDTIPSLIKILQEKYDYYTKNYPNHEITYDIDYTSIEFIGKLFYVSEEAWKEGETLRREAREQALLEKDRILYEKLHSKFNKS